jgi:hypothetical protein
VRDVEEQRAGGIRHVDRPLAAQSQPHVVLRQQDVGDPLVDVGLVLAQPQQLRRGEARECAVAGGGDERRQADALLDLLALLAGPLVVPEDRRAQHRLVGVERDEAVHLAGQPDPGDVLGSQLLERLLRAAPPVLGVLLGPSAPRRGQAVLDLGAGDDLAVLGHGERLHAARPDVEPDRDAHSVTARPDPAEA